MKTLTELGLTYKKAQKYIETNICAECDSGLSIAWGGSLGINEYIIRCGNNPEHTGHKRPYVPTMQTTPGIPGWKLSNRRKSEMVEQLGPDKAHHLMRYEGSAFLSKEDARDIIQTLWPKAPDTEVKKAMLICWQYRLNPLMKHLYLLPFQNHKTGETTWATVLGIKTARLLAARQGRYSYFDDTPRVMSEKEQMRIFGKSDTTKTWAITKIRDEHGNEAQGYGYWLNADSIYGTEKGNTKENMAFIRSERAALDRLFPDVAPPEVEVIDERYIPPLQVPKITTEPPPVGESPAPPPTSPALAPTAPAAGKQNGKIQEEMPRVDNLYALAGYVATKYKIMLPEVTKKANKEGLELFESHREYWDTAMALKKEREVKA